MTDIIVKQMPSLKKAYKKLDANKKLHVDNAINAIIKNPKIGEEKKRDLAGVFVYKFKIHHQEILLAYEWSLKERLLLTLIYHS